MAVIKHRKKSNDCSGSEIKLTLAGNPNVGKSTVFNALTGMKQHTGNWTGKTVATAQGRFFVGDKAYILTDLPGTYSLIPHSKEEAVARDYIAFSGDKGVIVVCDASCLERNLNLVLQVMEITDSVIVCVNLMDEARKKQINVDLSALEKLLGVPVCGTSARSGDGLDGLKALISHIGESENERKPFSVKYPLPIERAIETLSAELEPLLKGKIPVRFTALRLLEHSEDFIDTAAASAVPELKELLNDTSSGLGSAMAAAEKELAENGICTARLRDMIIMEIIRTAERLAEKAVSCSSPCYYRRDMRIDGILTHKIWGIPVMAAILALIFYITTVLSNYPSEWLSSAFSSLGTLLRSALDQTTLPIWLVSLLTDGIYCVLSWVISVMLPPMAIFFPLFTLLEDAGYLPRAAFNLDRYFRRCGACGKQALTMAMGLGCNAVGITGCRIIDSKRERLIAMLTNVFMPCNGRFPALIALSAAFLGSYGAVSAAVATLAVLAGGILTFAMSALLTKTALKGTPSSFALELPPYRRPQIGKVLVRSLLDRTISVLGRAVTAAAPAGVIIWLMTNINIGESSVLEICADFADPFGRLIGLDGVIIMAFILGFPANEIVLPIALMAYLGTGSLTDYTSFESLGEILTANGWTPVTAVCMMIMVLCHFPCATACMTLKKESGSLKTTLAAMALPTAIGIILCFIVSTAARLLF